MTPRDRRPVVLVADDDESILALLEYRLERSGYDVASATNGQRALELVTERQPDLALFDVMMPGLDGYELTRRVKRDGISPSMKVILLTSRGQESDVSAGFAAGADDYVKKPFNPDELRTRVRAALAR